MEPRIERKSMRLIALVASSRLTDKALDLYQDEQMPIIFRAHAYGTGRTDVEDILGFGNIEKRMLITIADRPRAKRLLKDLRRKLHLGDPNTGIAFTIRITGMSTVLFNMLNYEAPEAEKEEMEDMKEETIHSMVVAIVKDGYSEEVMNAARRAGAGGGTVIHSRQIGNEKIMSLLGLNVQNKTEVVFILTVPDKRAALMEAITRSCGINTDASGLVLSLPVGDVTGIDLD